MPGKCARGSIPDPSTPSTATERTLLVVRTRSELAQGLASLRQGGRRVGQQFQSTGDVPCHARICRLYAQLIGHARHESIQKGAHFPFRKRTGKFIDLFAIDEGLDAGNAAYAVTRSKLLVVVGVDLGQQELAIIFSGKLLQEGLQRFAGTTPRRPEIDHHRAMLRFLENLLLKIGKTDIECVF